MSMHILMTSDFDCTTPGLPATSRNVSRPKIPQRECGGHQGASEEPTSIDVPPVSGGLTANGLVLNDTGYLNLVKTGQLSNSTILVQPIGHVQTPASQRTNVTLVSSNNRDFGSRGHVTLVPGLNQIGPLSLTNDSPNP